MQKIEHPALSAIGWLIHGFYTREGAPEAVMTLRQVHSAEARYVTGPFSPDAVPEGDALVTDQPDLLIGVRTADCVPVLFADRKKKIVGVAHAGWRGALDGIAEKTIDEMRLLGSAPGDIVAVIGPCIGPHSYEVSQDFQKPFVHQDKNNALFFKQAQKTGHLMFDLPGYVAARLQKTGVTSVHDLACDTLSDETRFFSHRRGTLRGKVDYGRQISLIGIRKTP